MRVLSHDDSGGDAHRAPRATRDETTLGASPGGFADPPPVPPRRAIVIAFIVAAAFLMQGLDTMLIAVAIPTMAAALDVPALSLHLAITAYTISLAVFMPVSGWIADRLGARLVFCASMVIFTLGSVLCGFSQSLAPMIAARILQGFGGALMTPIGRLVVLRAFGRDRTLDAMTYMTTPVLIGPLIGPLIGGAIITYAPWNWIFFVVVPVSIAAVVAALIVFPADAPAERRPFDGPGFLIAALGLVAFQLGIENLGHPFFAGRLGSVVIFASVAAIVPLYLWHARRIADPALDIRLFAVPSYAVGVIGGGVGRIGLNSTTFLQPVLLQVGLGFSPLAVGLYAFASTLGAFGSKPIIRRSLFRFGYRRLLIGVSIAGAVLLGAMALVRPGVAPPVLLALVIVLGAVRTMHFNAVNTLTFSDVPHERLSSAVGAAGVFQQLSMGLGISVSSAVLALAQDPEVGLTPRDFSIAFVVMAAIPILSLPSLLRLAPAHGRAAGHPAPPDGTP